MNCVICPHVNLDPHHGRRCGASSHGQPVVDRLPPTHDKVPGSVEQVLAPSWSQQSWLNGDASDADGP